MFSGKFSKKISMKKMTAVFLAVVFSIALSMTAFAASVKPMELEEDDSYVWGLDYDGRVTCEKEDGTPVRGWAVRDGDIYYFDKKGVMRTGWVKYDRKWYFFYDEEYITEHDLDGEVLPGTMAVDTVIDNYKIGSEGEMIKCRW